MDSDQAMRHELCSGAETYGFSGSTSASFASSKSETVVLENGPRVEPRMRLVFDDTEASRVVELEAGDELSVGASPAADVRLRDPTVSAIHAAFAHTGAAIEVRDLRSRNGVRVAGVRVSTALLSAGAVVELGHVAVRLEPVESRGAQQDEAILSTIVGNSVPMRRLGGSVRKLAPLRLPVLVRGESGTGKELVARALHDESPRASKPFVALNAATISRELAESELFGHVKGAFTGAMRERRGAFREAHQGTLFLDEIASLPLDVQAKLLRAVEDGVVRPVGADAGARVDVRLVVATCEPLEQMVASRRFRADLYERLAVCVLRVPPLRDRTEDIELLCRHLLASSEIGPRELEACAIAALRAYRFPGNVRELRNVIMQAAVRASGVIRADHILAVFAERQGGRRPKISAREALRIFEESARNISEAARRANIPRTSMRDLLRASKEGDEEGNEKGAST